MSTDQWFYSTNEEDRIGPVTLEELIALLAKGTITFDTLVWRPSLKAWQPIKQTPEIITNYPTVQPPPLPKQKIDDPPESSFSSPTPDSFATSEEVLFGDRKPKREPMTEQGLQIGWLNFYIYVRIPLGILISIGSVIATFMTGNMPVFLVTLTLISVEICFAIFLLIGLHKRRLWGWRLNWLSLLLEVFLWPLERTNDPMEYYALVGAFVLFWFLPNAIYFMKRYKLFAKHDLPKGMDFTGKTPVD